MIIRIIHKVMEKLSRVSDIQLRRIYYGHIKQKVIFDLRKITVVMFSVYVTRKHSTPETVQSKSELKSDIDAGGYVGYALVITNMKKKH